MPSPVSPPPLSLSAAKGSVLRQKNKEPVNVRERRAPIGSIGKPVIAAPHGYAMGLALGIVLECDLIVAAGKNSK